MEIYKVRNLPIGAKTIQDCTIDWFERKQETLTYKGMDWMYAKWYTDDWELINFNASFTLSDNWFYDIVSEK